jgi:multidrug efflux pump
MVTKPWSQRKKTTPQLQVEAAGKLSTIPGVRVISLIPPALPGGGDFPVDFVVSSTAEPERLTEFANQLVARAFQSGVFMFADSDLKFDQPQAEVVFDRDKLRSQGVDLGQAGRDLSTMLGGDFVNRFSIQGRSYRSFLDQQAGGSPDQLGRLRHGADNKLVPWRSLSSERRPGGAEPVLLLNAVRIRASSLGRPARWALRDPRGRGGEREPAEGVRSTSPASRGERKAASSSEPSCSRPS